MENTGLRKDASTMWEVLRFDTEEEFTKVHNEIANLYFKAHISAAKPMDFGVAYNKVEFLDTFMAGLMKLHTEGIPLLKLLHVAFIQPADRESRVMLGGKPGSQGESSELSKFMEEDEKMKALSPEDRHAYIKATASAIEKIMGGQ